MRFATGSLVARLLVPLFAVTACPVPAGATSIWIEGEAATQKDVNKHVWYDAVKKEGMSGGDWLSHYDQGKPGTASYKFESPEAGPFTFWWRGNPLAAKVSYALNGAAPVEIDFAEKRGEYMISEKPDHRFLAWVKVGKVALKAGDNTIAFNIHGDIANSGGIDCFLLDNSGFVPSGTLKPGGAAPEAEPSATADEAIWIEGEKPAAADVTKHGWYDAVKKEGMSGGDWLSHYDGNKPGTRHLQVRRRQGRPVHLLVARQSVCRQSGLQTQQHRLEGNRLCRQTRRVHGLRQAGPPLSGLGQSRQGPAPRRRQYHRLQHPRRNCQQRRHRLFLLHPGAVRSLGHQQTQFEPARQERQRRRGFRSCSTSIRSRPTR